MSGWWIELFPRIVTEELVADYDADGQLQPVFTLANVYPGEDFDRIVTGTFLAWLGMGFFCRFEAPGRPFHPSDVPPHNR